MSARPKHFLAVALAVLAIGGGTGAALAATSSSSSAAAVAARSGDGGPLAAVAAYVNLTVTQVRQQLESGKSLAQIAQAQGRTVAGLKAAIIADATSHLKQAVADGKLTQAQADERLAQLKANIDDIVNRTGPPGPRP